MKIRNVHIVTVNDHSLSKERSFEADAGNVEYIKNMYNDLVTLTFNHRFNEQDIKDYARVIMHPLKITFTTAKIFVKDAVNTANNLRQTQTQTQTQNGKETQ